jgi:CubicO group peptidase (beta-lactamase class C family)
VQAPPAELGLDPNALGRLASKAEHLTRRAGLPSSQLAVARYGRVGAVYTFGRPRSNEPLYVGFSTTKAVFSSAVWLLLQDGRLTIEATVGELSPALASAPIAGVTVEQLLTHMAGFPEGHLPPEQWADPDKRLQTMASWHLEWPPGTRFQYHPTATMWVLAELVEQVTQCDFRAFVADHVLAPLGLHELRLGATEDQAERVARVEPVVHVGRPLPRMLLGLIGLRIPGRLLDEHYFETFNRPAVQCVGVPSSGAVTDAASLALFYQALLGTPPPGTEVPWSDHTRSEGTRIRSGGLRDPMTGQVANRALGVVVAGTGRRSMRGFGQACSPATFGHPGAGGQVAWADPATGVSFAFLTGGFDRNLIRMGLRGGALSNLAARCAT